jgi:phosphoribosyl-dephospho-CoA transferase
VNTLRFRRHDLVWLDPELDAGLFAEAEQSDLARDWASRALPLVVARQSASLAIQPHQIILGFTLPSAPMRTRVTLRTDRAAIIRHTRPLPLHDAIKHAPQTWLPGLNSLTALFARTGTVARVYGSLSSEAYSGKPYLDATSDIDLLLECTHDTKLRELLLEMESFPYGLPRIDGEILSASGWAVAWRELAAAMRVDAPRQVLAKSDTEACLIPIAEFTQPLLTLENAVGNGCSDNSLSYAAHVGANSFARSSSYVRINSHLQTQQLRFLD